MNHSYLFLLFLSQYLTCYIHETMLYFFFILFFLLLIIIDDMSH